MTYNVFSGTLNPTHFTSSQKGGGSTATAPTNFRHMSVVAKIPLGMGVGLSQGDFVLDGDPAPPEKRGTAPQFSAHVCCGQMDQEAT